MAFGRFERKQGQAPMSEINVTPLVDVMMVLLVIFIITAPLMVSSLQLDLPKAEGAKTNSTPARAVKLSIDAKGAVYLDNKAATLDELKRSLNEQATKALEAGRSELPEVQLRADEHVPYGRVVEVMDLAQQAGFYRIGFVTERKPSAGKR